MIIESVLIHLLIIAGALGLCLCLEYRQRTRRAADCQSMVRLQDPSIADEAA